MCSNFSNYLFDRMMSMGQEIDPAVLHNSTIHLHPDMSSKCFSLPRFLELCANDHFISFTTIQTS